MTDKKAKIITASIMILGCAVIVCLFLLEAYVPLGVIIGLFAINGMAVGVWSLFCWLVEAGEATLEPISCDGEVGEAGEFSMDDIDNIIAEVKEGIK